MRRNKIDNLGNHFQWLDGAEAEPLQTRRLEYSRNQFIKVSLPGQIASIRAQVNPGQDNLFVATRNEFTDLFERSLRLDASAPAAYAWNDAE